MSPESPLSALFDLPKYYLSQALDYLAALDDDAESIQRIEAAVYAPDSPEREVKADHNIDV